MYGRCVKYYHWVLVIFQSVLHNLFILILFTFAATNSIVIHIILYQLIRCYKVRMHVYLSLVFHCHYLNILFEFLITDLICSFVLWHRWVSHIILLSWMWNRISFFLLQAIHLIKVLSPKRLLFCECNCIYRSLQRFVEKGCVLFELFEFPT